MRRAARPLWASVFVCLLAGPAFAGDDRPFSQHELEDMPRWLNVAVGMLGFAAATTAYPLVAVADHRKANELHADWSFPHFRAAVSSRSDQKRRVAFRGE